MSVKIAYFSPLKKRNYLSPDIKKLQNIQFEKIGPQVPKPHKKKQITKLSDNNPQHQKQHVIIRDRSQRKLYLPKKEQKERQKERSNSISQNGQYRAGKFIANYKIQFRTKLPQKNPKAPESTIITEVSKQRITFKTKKLQFSPKKIDLKEPQTKLDITKIRIPIKKLSFKCQNQRSLQSTEGSTKDILHKRSLNIDDSNSAIVTLVARKQSIKKKPHLNDFYQGKLLGKGYFGQVYIVKHKEIGFVCAMKIISRQLVKKQKTEDQIIRQLKISSYVNHPNIIQLYGYFIDENNIYILQQLMTEDQLYKIMKKHRVFTQRQTANIVNQSLSALQYLHQQNITHRDIKPQNLLVEKGVVKFCDFGWAVYDPFDFRTSNIGTLLYLSPENVKGTGYDKRNDIWAMGILTYQMLIGNVPFTIWGEDQKHKIISEQVRFPLYMQISDIAKDFILRMLQKDPDNRSTIAELQTHPFLVNSGITQYIPIQ